MKEIHAPRETITDCAVEMHGYVLCVIVKRWLQRREGSRLTIKAIAIPSPWNMYPKAQIANALEFAGSITASALKAMVPTSIWSRLSSNVYGSHRIVRTKGKTKNAPVMAKERS